ncbi:RNA-binding protein [Methanobacterium sp. 42_16]|uniref:RNA-binding protein n=1 Tax=Methanobacterium sp. 42_16 TaxID=1641383 RepID=UPI000748988A|nr:RNA-binding protein [Methanobacterium sp. 42_16]KUK74677.1 MAG: RNA-binding protein [Methanobacterium sp. 42_16]
MKIKKRYHLKKKKLKEFEAKLGPYSSLIPSKTKVEILESDLPDLILVDGDPLIMILDGEPFPTLKGALKHPLESQVVVVDMGAVKFMASGADVMSPGIVEADPQIHEGDTVIVVDENHHKPLAMGTAIINGQEMVESNKGKAVRTLHYIGDKIWNLEI